MGITATAAANWDVDRQTSGGAGIDYLAGVNIPCTSAGFANLAGDAVSIYGTGVEASAGYTPQIMMFF